MTMKTDQAILNGRIYADQILDRRVVLKGTRRRSSAGVVIAEGDSWFDYPFCDVLKVLEDRYTYDVESVAHHGDRLEDMAYTGELVEFTSRLDKLLRNHVVPKAVLLSGGGNDIAGIEFGALLNHAFSTSPGLNESVVHGVVDQRLRDAYITVLSQVTRLCERTMGLRLPIIVHGYDYPVPDGRGFAGGFWFLPGPWLGPRLRLKGYLNASQCTQLAMTLIDRFNNMLQGVTSLADFAHVRFVDLRGTLSNRADYKQWWSNELHPSRQGFEALAKKLAGVLNDLPPGGSHARS
jgi:lysophospholipase L1-like esterase